MKGFGFMRDVTRALALQRVRIEILPTNTTILVKLDHTEGIVAFTLSIAKALEMRNLLDKAVIASGSKTPSGP
jgi:hypothetical protein